jgi:NDP-sugar pyrophosphorylase family protein
VFNGDILTDFDIGAIVRQHLENRAAVTLTLYRCEPSAPVWRHPSRRRRARAGVS